MLLTFFIVFKLCAKSNNYLVITKINAGATFPGMTSYLFSDNPAREPLKDRIFSVYPNICYGVDLESNKLLNFYETNLNLGVGLLYGKASTGEVETYYGISKYTITSLPIMLWAKIQTMGKIVPYVKVGIGTERTELIEKYNSREESDFDLKEWFFSWGFGAGLDLNIFDNFTLSLFVNSIIKEGGIAKKFNDFRKIDYDYRNGIFFSGIQFGYKI
jgi:opacity protein-like surface antigen